MTEQDLDYLSELLDEQAQDEILLELGRKHFEKLEQDKLKKD